MIDLEHSLVRWLLFFAVLIVLIAVKIYVRKRRKKVAAQALAAANAATDESDPSDLDSSH